MNQKNLYQEGLKLIACITMLIDHIGYVVVPYIQLPNWMPLYYTCRIIGRISFPIYCFLLSEGMRHTRNPYKYILRLLFCFFLTELPYDFCFEGGFCWESQNVMLTLTLGAMMLLCMQKTKHNGWKLLLILPFALLADLSQGDYGGRGIFMIAAFALLKGELQQGFGLLTVNAMSPHMMVNVLGGRFSLQLFGTFAMLPICCYNGKKRTHSRVLQWVFYLFYPLHLLFLWGISQWIL